MSRPYNTTDLDPETAFERHVYHRDQFAHFLRWTHVLKEARIGDTVVDFGCGRGSLLEVLYRNKFKPASYTGFDIREATLAKARKHFEVCKFPVEFRAADLTSPELEPSLHTLQANRVCSFEVLEHVGRQNCQAFLRNFRACGSPDAMYYLSTPNYDERVGAAGNHTYDSGDGRGEAPQEWGFHELEEQLAQAGFTVVRTYGTFASQRDYKPHLTPAQAEVFEALHAYYDSNLVANIMAPIVPAEYARNTLWVLTASGEPRATAPQPKTEETTMEDQPIQALTEDELELAWEETELPLDFTSSVAVVETQLTSAIQEATGNEELHIKLDLAPLVPEREPDPTPDDPRAEYDLVRFLDWQMDGVRRFANGELRTFKRCKRRWWLTYYRKLGLHKEAITGAAPLGTRIHAALAVYYDPRTPRASAAAAARLTLEQTIAQDADWLVEHEQSTVELLKDAELARIMLDGYLEWVLETGADEGLEITAPEAVLDVDARFNLEQPVRLIAKLDVRATRVADGSRVFIDHKTVGSLTEPLRMLLMDEQMLQYELAEFLNLLELGADAESEYTSGALYNMLKKVKRSARATPPFFDRVEVRHNIHELRSYWARVRGTVKEILALEQALNVGAAHTEVCQPNPTRDCTWQCEFVNVCPMFDDGSRVEDYVASQFVEINPLQRYAPADA